MSAEESRVLKDELKVLKSKLEVLTKSKKNLDSLIYKLDVRYKLEHYISVYIFPQKLSEKMIWKP